MQEPEEFRYQRAYVFIELLIVIAFLAVLAATVLAAIDPFEQLKKGIDASRNNLTNTVYSAILRNYAISGSYPWSSDLNNITLDSQDGSKVIQTLVDSGELKSDFTKIIAKEASSIYLTASHDGKILSLCFRAESKSYRPSTYYCSGETCFVCVGENNQLAGGTPPSSGIQISPSVSPSPTITASSGSSGGISLSSDEPITRNVMVIDFNPIIESRGGERLRTVTGWNDPITLENQYIQDIRSASGGYLNYQIVKLLGNLDTYPAKGNGYIFTDDAYLKALSGSPDANAQAIIDYRKLIKDYGVCDLVNRGEVNELWLWGGPWFGYWEAAMAGPNAFVTNAPPITGTSCTKSLHVMGFSYERGNPEMLEDFGHRVEGTMRNFFGGWFAGANTDWDKFTKGRAFHPNDGAFPYGCGSVHEPFNAGGAYDWSNTSVVNTVCDGWLRYPPAPTNIQPLSCTTWGCSGYGYLKWWLGHLPKVTGENNGKLNNWWKYLTATD